jgi:hypothetical protein
MAVLLGGRWFPYIESSNKKEGKKEAADVALRVLMAEGSYQMVDVPQAVSFATCSLLTGRNSR